MNNTAERTAMMHLRIAEQGKLHSLEGNYSEALRHYQEALRMLEKEEKRDVFFQHYSQCIMEALELSESYDSVISYCEKYLDHLEEHDEEHPWIKGLNAHILEKMAVQYLWKGEQEEALELFKEVKELATANSQKITTQFLSWLQRGYHISKNQMADVLKRNHYYIVRKDTVNKGLALQLPDAINPTF